MYFRDGRIGLNIVKIRHQRHSYGTGLQDEAENIITVTISCLRSRLYAKTALVMGVNYALLPLVVILNQYYPLSRFINISILNIDDIRGAEIFLIFVLKRETLSELAQRLSWCQRTQPSRPVAKTQL
ncbi:hypothetical protein J6590_061383 [Homalodisca vitripennis]|nr:hypothetical protein J6590_061383 [Homalodisca vitripennis]